MLYYNYKTRTVSHVTDHRAKYCSSIYCCVHEILCISSNRCISLELHAFFLI